MANARVRSGRAVDPQIIDARDAIAIDETVIDDAGVAVVGPRPERTQWRTRTMRVATVALATLVAVGTGCTAPEDPDTTDPPAAAAPLWTVAARDAAMQRLEAARSAAPRFSLHKATAAARSIRTSGPLSPVVARTDADKASVSKAFFRDYGAAIGVMDPAVLRQVASHTDALGETHLTWKQFHGSIPVFGATVKTHFDRAHRLKAVNGTVIPNVGVDPTPTWSRDDAGAIAHASVVAERGAVDNLHVGAATLYVFRTGLALGVPGNNHLAWEIEVTDGAWVRDLVYVDAHSGKVLDTIAGVHDALYRRAYDGHHLPNPPPNYPNGTFWKEGDPFPTSSVEANNMLLASKETYDFFNLAFGRDSFDGEGATMDAIFDRGYSCPNASWNGTFISFCPGLTTDDVTAHEWGHAYTQYTHGLIYQWQPGALNEAYSDIWGEIVDSLNGRGTDTPGTARTAGECSEFSPPVGTLRVNAPAAIAGDYVAQSAGFGPPLTTTGVSGDVVAAIDAGPVTTDGCTAISNDLTGKIALIDRGTCEFSTKVLNAQHRGAIGVIIANNVSTGLPGMGAGVDAPFVTIPSLGVQQSAGTAIRGQLASTTVHATLLAAPGEDVSYRWLLGETSSLGVIRDMWNPTCHGNPGKVSDTAFYHCASTDSGGVHINSGVPNHGFALLVDGGTYNGQTVAAIGLTKAAHLYFHASTTYQVEDSDFADHADALEASCDDLLGASLPSLTGGPPEVIGATDCAQVTAMIAAVELRTPPTFCNFPPLLSPVNAPACAASTTTGVPSLIASYDFEAGASGFEATRTTASETFTERDWSLSSTLPARSGTGWFAPDSGAVATCSAETDESGVLHLTSPAIVLPASTVFARATFEHWVATEAGWDGANLKVSVNGGPFQLVPPSEITFNNYGFFLISAEDGSTNPLAGQPSWTGTNPGTVNGGSWGRTHVNLGNFARAGDTVRVRWDFGTDRCDGRVGWYVDNVNVFSCTPNVPGVTVSDVTKTEGNAGSSEARFVVRLSQPTITRVSVTYRTVDGSAQHGNDFDRAEGTLVIPPGATTATIPVLVKGDVVAEGDESFTFELTGAMNATITDGQAVGTIIDDDV